MARKWIVQIKDAFGRTSKVIYDGVLEKTMVKAIGVPLNNFDDLDNELNEVLVRVFSAIMEIKHRVAVIDIAQWAELYEDVSTEKKRDKFANSVKDVFGMAMPEDRIIWLNPRLCKREYNVLVMTIIHELLHVRFPELKEDKIMDLERKYSGIYDYKRIDPKQEALKKCQRQIL